MERLVRLTTRQSRPVVRSRFMALLLILAILGLAPVSECAPLVSAFLDAKRFSVDQTATLSVTINDADGTIGELPSVDGLAFQQRGQSSQHQLVNGSLSSSVSLLFEVQASRPGTFTIPPIAVTVDGKQVLTEALTFEVTSPAAGIPALPNQQGGGAGAPSMGGREAGQMAFLRISPVKEESYTGELLPVEVKAYFRRGLRASLNSHPRLSGDGFVFSESKEEPVQTEEVVDNVPYAVLTWPGALSGIKEGRHAVSVAMEATLLIPAGNGRRRVPGGDPFFGNDLFADFFNQQQMLEKKIQIVSKDMDLQVLPLPAEGKPADFAGAIGNFELEVQAQPTDVGVGDPIALTMTVQGTGNFDRVEAPVLREAEGWKIYPPAAKFTQGDNPGQGRKVFDQALIAGSADKTAIPPLAFSFFDPESRQYKTLHSPSIPLRIDKAENGEKREKLNGGEDGQGRSPAAGAKDGGNSQPEGEQVRSQKKAERTEAGELALAPLHSPIGSLQQGLIPLVAQTGFQAAILILLLSLVVVALFKLRARRLVNNPDLCRRREMTRLLDLRVREAKEIAERDNSRNFLIICRRAMQEQLGLLWQTEPGAITLSDLRQRLPEDSELIPLLAIAESGAYAGDGQGCPNGAGARDGGSGDGQGSFFDATSGHHLSCQEMLDYVLKMENALRRLR